MANIQKWSTVASKQVYKHGWFAVKEDTCLLPNGKILAPYYIVDVPNFVNIIIVTPSQEMIMVQQYRYAGGFVTTEPAGGLIDEGEEPLEAAIREMKEETGYTSNDVSFLYETFVNPALQPTKAYFFLAQNAHKTTDLHLDEYEDLNTILLSKQQVLDMLHENKFYQSIQLGAIYKACIQLGWLKTNP